MPAKKAPAAKTESVVKKKPAAKKKTTVKKKETKKAPAAEKKSTAEKKPVAKKKAVSKKSPANAMGFKPGVPKEKPKGRIYEGPLNVNAKPKKADTIFFGVGGVPHSAKPQGHPEAVRRLHELGLGVYEMEFVHGVRIRPETCELVKAAQAETGVHVTAHGPYYVNLYSLEEEKVEASRKRVLDTARALAACGGDGACFHAGFYQKRDPAEVHAFMTKQIGELVDILEKEGCPVRLDPETTGKGSQFGSLAELCEMGDALQGKNMSITIDFAHIHARTAGAMNTYDEFAGQLELMKNKLGKEALSSMHIHLSGIAYTEKGEAHHLELDDSDMNYEDLFRALIDFGASGRVVCESPALEYDALIMQKAYRRLAGTK
ncbi:MAG: TIM barrel protein [Nitrospinaceae bacterium]|nr:TIM barrel protein [Nitrospinaceae bacterium]MBT3433817.1 TIM barrel protein [Nitrospinaceae bacterium]MBT5369091.1 TIM barrel protein [Nitrospinaceae bacterium]MBT6395029.1 TIM barrel protein [Nitrospinaceae bacterium]MBT7857472.1 TIM barrel protein [Nitrospinaceae bacterium]